MRPLIAFSFLVVACGGNAASAPMENAINFPGTLENGPQIGSNRNIAVSIPAEQSKTYAVNNMGNQTQVGLRITYDYTDACDPSEFHQLTTLIGDLEPGQSTKIDYVDVEFLKLDGAPRKVCVGYRSPDGQWHFDAGANASLVESGNVWTARVAIGAPAADALKVVLSGGGQPLRRISYPIAGAK